MAKELFDSVQEQRGELLSNKVADRINQLIIDESEVVARYDMKRRHTK